MDFRHSRRKARRRYSRRAVLGAMGAAAGTLAAPNLSRAATGGAGASAAAAGKAAALEETYETHAQGIRILPGQWRPHYPWEHIAWVSPPWPSQDYLWLDFPEAIFTSQGLLYLSHVNPPIPTVFSDLPKVPWEQTAEGVAYERTLPNGVVFGGRVAQSSGNTVDLDLLLRNGSKAKLANITLQTCAFLRGIKEFAHYTLENKFVHVPKEGWIPMTRALVLPEGTAPFRVGWRTSGKRVADVPMAVTLSNATQRLLAFTWHEHTLSLIGNPHHPCVHADPKFPDLNPGDAATIRGKLIFFEGGLKDFDYSQYIGAQA